MEGLFKKYDENGRLEEIRNYDEGKHIGFWPNGDIRFEEEGTFKDGKKEGLWKSYFKDGQLREEINFKNDKREGFYKKYHEGLAFFWLVQS